MANQLPHQFTMIHPWGADQIEIVHEADRLRFTHRRRQSGLQDVLHWPALLLIVAAYAAYRVLSALNGPRPDTPMWATLTSWIFVAQMMVFAALVLLFVYRKWTRRDRAWELEFTATNTYWRIGFDNYQLDDCRGIRVVVYPEPEPPRPDQRNSSAPNSNPAAVASELWAGVSLVIGEQRLIRGLYLGMPLECMQDFAWQIHQALNEFRSVHALEPLPPIEVIETEKQSAGRQSHTMPNRPTRSLLSRLGWSGLFALISDRWACTIWCLAQFATVAGAWIVCGDQRGSILHMVVFLNLVLLLAAWRYSASFKKNDAD